MRMSLTPEYVRWIAFWGFVTWMIVWANVSLWFGLRHGGHRPVAQVVWTAIVSSAVMLNAFV